MLAPSKLAHPLSLNAPFDKIGGLTSRSHLSPLPPHIDNTSDSQSIIPSSSALESCLSTLLFIFPLFPPMSLPSFVTALDF
ncbi:hypothetical protein EGR_04576 [Echinococcus granulosus]|uniref:Uncharacterized protein n=1 Tax=Echinococcus granulosus TaxID=6210 RepID=W6UQH7_ECHGR|nr:hypothetical protein EGR_04576 [Echinococcus granulosus]EUB60557.1 hypothetical protein EGR_04576 [Echinococcus granulosus]